MNRSFTDGEEDWKPKVWNRLKTSVSSSERKVDTGRASIRVCEFPYNGAINRVQSDYEFVFICHELYGQKSGPSWNNRGVARVRQ